MTTRSILFSIALEHDFYQNKWCPELEIFPTEDCRELIADWRFVIKKQPYGISVIAPFIAGQPDFDINDTRTFSFTLKLISPHFMLFTDLTHLSAQKPYRFVNATAQPQLQAVEGSSLFSERNAFATIEVDSAKLFADPTQWPTHYTYRFAVVAVQWNYYVVTNYKSSRFEVHHDPESDDNVLQFIKTPLGSVSDLDDPIAQSLAEKYPDAHHYLFTSKEIIPYRDQAIDGIQLKKDDKVWIHNLPNPRIWDNGTRLIKLMND